MCNSQVFARLGEVANWEGMSKSHFEKGVWRLVHYCGSNDKLHFGLSVVLIPQWPGMRRLNLLQQKSQGLNLVQYSRLRERMLLSESDFNKVLGLIVNLDTCVFVTHGPCLLWLTNVRPAMLKVIISTVHSEFLNLVVCLNGVHTVVPSRSMGLEVLTSLQVCHAFDTCHRTWTRMKIFSQVYMNDDRWWTVKKMLANFKSG